MPAPEGLARLARIFSGLLTGICAGRGILGPGEEEVKILAKIAQDSIPAIRQILIEELWHRRRQKNALVERTHLSNSTLGYRLEDLKVINVVAEAGGSFALTEEFKEICRKGKIFPEVTANAGPSSSASPIRSH